MKLLLLTAIIAAVTSSPVSNGNGTWPWQVGKLYRYDVLSHTLTIFEGMSHGSAFKAQYIVSVKAPGHLLAKLENSSYAPIQTNLPNKYRLPSDLKYQPLPAMDQTFENFVDGGRVVSINVPSTLPLSYTNFLKGLISTIQVDLSPHRQVHSYPNSFDKNTFQGLFKKMETDVTGECETLYSVSPMGAEWRRELPKFATEEDPIEVIKIKNYGMCDKRANVYVGIPEDAVFQSSAHNNEHKQMIKHTFEGRILAGKQGPIYKAGCRTTSLASPLVFGKQKSEVFSYVGLNLISIGEDTNDGMQMKEYRSVNSLLYTIDNSVLFTRNDPETVAKALRLLQETASLLQKPNDLHKENFLLKFNTLVYILASFNSNQLMQITDIVEISKNSKNVAKSGMWTIYRDALALTGTTEAYEHIKSWIWNKKIEGKEAAEVISVVGASLSNPSEDTIRDFFKFATDPVVVELEYVNITTILAASKLLRSAKNNSFIEETVIPYLDKELKHAITNSDFRKTQTYVKVLGSLAQPSVLKVFAPYLEGQIPVTKYIRIQMVLNLKQLAKLKDDHVRAVLYSILKNTAEPYEVRVVAIHNIFIAVPSLEMMLVLARMTLIDPSIQVRAALTSSIHSAANLKDPRFTELAKIAQSVSDIVTKKTFDSTYSTNTILDGYESEDDYNYFSHFTSIDSDNSFWRKYLSTSVNIKETGFGEESEMTVSVSDVREFLNYFVRILSEPSKIDPKFKFSAEQIATILNITRAHQPLEGAIFMDNMNVQKLFTFNEKDINGLINDMSKSLENLLVGIDVEYTKVLYMKNIKVMFPVASGMPYLYDYTEPVFIMAKANAAAQVNNVNNAIAGFLKTNIDLTYSRDVHSTICFADVFGDQFAISGVMSDLQVYIPYKINTDFNAGQIKVQIEPLHAGKDINLVQFSVVPYTGIYKHDSENFEIQPIKRSTLTESIDVKFGPTSGMVYQLQGLSYSSDYKDVEGLYSDDFWVNIGRIIYQKDIAFTEFSFKYLGKEANVKSTTFNLYLDTLYNQNYDGNMGPADVTKHVEPHSTARREEITRKVASGIQSAKVHLLDFSAEFDGAEKVVFVFTGAYASSLVDSKIQAAFFAYGTEQVNGVLKIDRNSPKLSTLNFEEALKNEVKQTYEVNIKYRNADFHLKGYGERSEKYTEMLKKDPMAKQCLEEISKKNFFQKNCYNMTVIAYVPDYFKTTITLNEIDPIYLSLSEYTYNKFVKQRVTWEAKSNTLNNFTGDEIEIDLQLFYYDDYVNYILTTENGSYSLENVESKWDYLYLLSTYAPITSMEDPLYLLVGNENLLYCAVDDNKVQTFSGRSYDYALTGSWHVVMIHNSDPAKELVILARRPIANQEEVYVSYKNEDEKFFELDIKPDGIAVKSNGNKICEGAHTMYWNEVEGAPLLEYYTLGEDIYIFNIQRRNIRLIYDKHRLVIITDEYRGSTMGICGRSSREIRDDYITPWGLVSLPEHYGASYSLEGEFSDPKTVALKEEAKLMAYQPVIKFTNILRNDADWSKAVNDTSNHFYDNNVK